MEETARHEEGVVTSLEAMVTLASQTSDAVTDPVAAGEVALPQLTVWLTAAEVSMVGAVVSRMVTVWVLVVVLWQVSVNVHVLVMTRLQTPPV
jgi:hypothetical protein